MKNSGVEWIGEIPEDWEVKKLKYICDPLASGGTPDSNNDQYYCENGTNWVAINDMSLVDYVENTAKHITNLAINEKKLKIYPKGTIIYSIYATLGHVAELSKPACINQALLALSIKDKSFNKSYFKYSLNAMKEYVLAFSSGNTQFNLNAQKVRNFTLLTPSFETQQHIASYLDKKCSKIEETIQNQQQVIEKLKAYKQSLITEAVTGKIKIQNEIPDFKYCNLGFIAEFKNGLNYNASDFGTEVKFLGVGDFQNYLVLNDESMFSNIITDTEIEDDYYLKNGDIIFVRSNGSKELVGRAIMVDNIDFKVTYSGFCIRLRNKEPKKINSKFLLYFFRSDYFRNELQRLSQGSNISNINQDLLSHIKIPLVDIQFQESVVDFLNKKCTAIDIAIEQKQNLIEKLTEYKKSLIYECVTGKKEI